MPRKQSGKPHAPEAPRIPQPSAAAQEQLDAPAGRAAFPIVGVGASAGGIEALRALLSNLPPDTGMAFVIVQHLDPSHESMLPDILGRSTAMPVKEATDDLMVEPHHVYVIPPGKLLIIESATLRLSPRATPRGPPRPFDHFLRSLAEEMGHKAIGVVLSGTGNDGTLGMEEVKAAGGITFAQDDTAEQTGMPRSAVAAGCVDLVLSPSEIAREIGRISHHPYVKHPVQTLEAPAAEPGIGRVLEVLLHAAGVDFAQYKFNTLQRRITRRMLLHRVDALDDYVSMLESNPAEVEALCADMLIGVTSFFRNPESYEVLKDKVFPELAGNRSRHDPVRVWALGCSTGEEAYSLAMAYSEHAEAAGTRVPMQIFATDLNEAGIDKARAGLYSKSITQDVSPERLRRFFVEIDGSYRISRPIRDMCTFARQNVLSDPPFSRIDLIACRNLLIYLGAELQQKLIPVLHYSLRSPGYLWLGASETIGSYRDLFEPIDAKSRIYVRRGPPATGSVRAPDSPLFIAPGRTPSVHSHESGGVKVDPQKEADRVLLAHYAPAAVVVNDDLEILQFRGDASPYLSPAPGRASLNLLRMLREGLLVPVRGAVHRAKREATAVREDGLRVKSNGGYRHLNVAVLPLIGTALPKGSLLIVFEEAGTQVRDPGSQAPIAHNRGEGGAEEELVRAKQELAATRDYLQSVIEQQEATNEELQSANEEVQSANEELQSVNEELETSKEELESSNEELATVNDELHTRNLELSQSNNDLTNLIGSADMAVVMLDADLHVRRFTPVAEKLLELAATDIGRPLRDVPLRLQRSDLAAMIARAVASGSAEELDVQNLQGRWFALRVRPYRTSENRIDGAVVVLIDMDNARRAAQVLRESEARFRLLADSAPVLIWVMGLHGYEMVNRAYDEFVGAQEPDVQRFDWTGFLHPEDREAYLAAYVDAFSRRGLFDASARMRRADGVYRWMRSVGLPRIVEDGQFLGYVGSTYDITDLKEAQDSLRELNRSKDVFLAMLSHELRNPLASIRNASHLLATGPVDAEAAARAQHIIERQTRNMVRLLDDLLEVSRITAGKISLRKETVSLTDAIRHAASATEHHRLQRQQELTITLPQTPLRMRGDPARLDQILGNLLVNASKFTPSGGHVWISVEVTKDLFDVAVITVRDNGQGITAAMLPRIFDLFVQGPLPANDHLAGVGIGLTLSKLLVELHGGTIEARSAGVGLGSEFIIRLPLVDSDIGERPGSWQPPPSQVRRRVLVVDDNQDAARSQAALLDLAGHSVRTAFDGGGALAIAREFRPDVILLDIGLPDEDGYQIVQRLRNDPAAKHALIVALTGFGSDADVERARAAGFDEHLTKPVDPERLLRFVAERKRSG